MNRELAEDYKRYLNGDIADEVERRVAELEDLRPESDDGYDAFGASRESLAQIMNVLYFFYKFYFRVEAHGLENVEKAPRALIIPNHMVPVPIDGVNIAATLFFAPEKPRMIRTIVHHFLALNPFLSTLVYRSGQVIGSSGNADRLFQGDNLVMIFPEGANAIRPYLSRRYRLNRFSPGFMEYAVKYDYPIIPTAVIGSEESTLVLTEIESMKGFMNIPRFAVTPTFPLLGFKGMFPYPSKFRIHFGEPMDFSDRKDDLDDPAKVKLMVEEVRLRVQKMLEEHLAELPKFPFF
ncbi:1-acyl-sn-glycerol-3-phosphate acyltransferase [bacterium]